MQAQGLSHHLMRRHMYCDKVLVRVRVCLCVYTCVFWCMYVCVHITTCTSNTVRCIFWIEWERWSFHMQMSVNQFLSSSRIEKSPDSLFENDFRVLHHCTGFARLVWGRFRVHLSFHLFKSFCVFCVCLSCPVLDILHCLPRAWECL